MQSARKVLAFQFEGTNVRHYFNKNKICTLCTKGKGVGKGFLMYKCLNINQLEI